MMFGGGMLLGWIFVVGVVVLVIWLVRSASGANNPFRTGAPASIAEHKTPAMQILEERFARGEIDKQEFEERKKELLGSS